MDKRLQESLAWAVAGAMLSYAASLPRIALSFPGAANAASRLRRMIPLLDGVYWPSGVYMRLLEPHLAAWHKRHAFVIVDTTSLSGRPWFVRIALRYRRHAIPLAWPIDEVGGNTIAFSSLEPLMDYVANLLPSGCCPTLVADRGFLCGRLVTWCHRHGCDFLVRVKRRTRFRWASDATTPICTLREVSATPRGLAAIHDALLSGRVECPLRFLLAWPELPPPPPPAILPPTPHRRPRGCYGFDGEGWRRIACRAWLKLVKQGHNTEAEPKLALAA